MKQLNTQAQANMIMYLMIFMVMIMFIMPTFGPLLGSYMGILLEPVIGFSGLYPLLTLFCAGLIVVSLSSLLTNFFTDWKQMGKNQERSRAFQKELGEARKNKNETKIKKLMKLQPEIMKQQTEASGGMMKPMLFLIIFIWPIFMWLRGFLADMPYYYFTTPWTQSVSLFSSPGFGQFWLWLYLIFSMIFGQLIRQGLKWLSWTEWWINIRKKIRPNSI